MQTYKVFYSDVHIPPGAEPPTMAKLIPTEFFAREEAMEEAYKCIHRGGVVWKIEGPDGFYLNREDVERQYRLFKGA